ncbi:MAG: hypothetical protein WCH61_06590, partial [bacterium]
VARMARAAAISVSFDQFIYVYFQVPTPSLSGARQRVRTRLLFCSGCPCEIGDVLQDLQIRSHREREARRLRVCETALEVLWRDCRAFRHCEIQSAQKKPVEPVTVGAM